MIFSSTLFLFVFLPIVLVVYYLIDYRLKNTWLLLASLIFYAWGEPKYIILMLTSIIVNYILGLAIEKKRNKAKSASVSILICSIIFNLFVLLYFKYYDFFVQNINRIASRDFPLKHIALPVGISFYTFQIMSYVIDVYRGNVTAQKNILNLGLYIALFPQLIAGPIVRYIDIEKQLKERRLCINQISDGVQRFIVGFSKKILIADRLAPLVDTIFAQNGISAPSAWIGIIAYSLQIFFDFSGYSDMAIGLGQMFGFKFCDNFNYPYISKTIKEFWRRWHISLSTWFKDYVYIPLGGSRCGVLRSYTNLIVIFFLTGFWHGASWNFIVWGLYYVVFLIIERLGFEKRLESMPQIIQHIYALLVIMIGWVFFRADGLRAAVVYIKSMFVWNENAWKDLYVLMDRQSVFVLIIGIILATPICKKIKYLKENGILKNLLLFCVFLVAISYMLGSGFSPFLYFRF